MNKGGMTNGYKSKIMRLDEYIEIYLYREQWEGRH